THTDLPLEDAIEFYNTTGVPVDISNYWLSNDKNNPMKYRFPPGSIIPAHGYKVVYEGRGTTSGFNTTGLGSFPQFTFNSANGDEAWLYSGTSTGGGRLTGFRTGVSFGASANGVSFGRYMTSDGRADFIAMTALSFGTSVTASDPPSQSYLNIFRTGTGAANPDPRVGPIVINEIHFHPPDIVSGTNFFDNSIDEFVELYNLTDTAIPLYDPAIYRADRDYSANEVADGVAIHRGEIYADGRTNTWRVRGTVDFDFPQNTTLAPGKFILVVNFDPTNTPVLNSFKTRFAVPNDTQIFGPYGGKLPNGNGGVDLTRPDPPQGPQHPDYHLVPRVLIDHVKYYDRDPWPTLTDAIVPISTDGGGASLQRISAYGYGNDPVNWRANPPTAGKYNTPSGIEAPSITTQPHDVTVSAGSTATFTVVAHGGQLRYQWTMDGTPISNETNAILRLVNVSTLLNHKFLVVTVTNVAGELSSTPVMLTVTAWPVEVLVDGRSVTSESVNARGSALISLQSTFDNGVVLYTLDGSDPSVSGMLYAGPFTLRATTFLRVVSYTSDLTQQADGPEVEIIILPALTASTRGGGAVSVFPPSGAYLSNSVVIVTAEPDPGWTFLQWQGDATGTNPTISVTMTRDKEVEALFGTPVTTSFIGSGTIVPNPGIAFHPYGSTLRLTAIPQAGSYFVRWGNGSTINPLTLSITSPNQTYIALFASLGGSQSYAFTAIVDGPGSVMVSPPGNLFPSGTSLTITATPEQGQDFLGWSGGAGGTANPLTLTLDASKVVTARFSKRASLRLASPSEGEDLRLTITGEMDTAYRILGSTNLADWMEIGRATNVYGTVQFSDPDALGLPWRFYRAVGE
ncbi:MAG TPA: lamin tail domain-containing protein, partial [Candidatus Saccharimonadales bacterium]|nr:lamin tail domain-containing protein [Candidatus Saccharimonadales bacterium]